MKHLIIGGVAGGATAAARIRRVDESAEIVLLEKGKYISYANCGLPYYIGGVIEDRNNLFVQTPQSFSKRFNIDVRTENEAIAIDSDNKMVRIKRANGEEYVESYDKLLLSPGSLPVRPNLQGIDLDGIFTLRNVDDTDNIKAFIKQNNVKRAVVVGGGFIGLEMAENLCHAKIDVSLVEMSNQVMAPVDFSIASYVHREMVEQGVSLYLEHGVEGFEHVNGGIRVKLSNNKTIETDMVLLSIGVRPSIELAQQAGLEIGERGIKVNNFLQTSSEHIYAVGDAIEYNHPISGKPWLNYLAGPANRQGRIVADNMVFGNTVKYEGSIGTSIAKVFNLTVAATGLPSKQLNRLNIAHQRSITISSSNAGYYPGAFQLTTKLTFDGDTGKLYGAQCVGVKGVDKRIDQLALLIKNGGSVIDLMFLEHSYAPPFSSAKDPIAIAGYVANNIITNEMKTIWWREIDELKNEALLLDVRTVDEYKLGSIEGSVNIPLDDLREHMGELPKNKKIIVFCAVGLRGYLAQRILKGYGYTEVYNLSGGYKTYSTAKANVNDFTPMTKQNTNIDNEETSIQHCAKTLKINACGLQCPGPILKLKKAADTTTEGDLIEVIATDAGFANDAQSWCNTTGNKLVSLVSKDGYHTAIIEKQAPKACETKTTCSDKNKTFIMFSDNLDKALATFVLANGAAATGQKVSLFFTFWGLNVIKKTNKPMVKKDLFSKMFAFMLPSSSLALKLSKMSFLGLGDKLMRHIMKQKNIDSLESLMQQAAENGVEFIACQMTMDMMGIDKSELMDNVNVGGVATYMERAEQSNVNLFI